MFFTLFLLLLFLLLLFLFTLRFFLQLFLLYIYIYIFIYISFFLSLSNLSLTHKFCLFFSSNALRLFIYPRVTKGIKLFYTTFSTYVWLCCLCHNSKGKDDFNMDVNCSILFISKVRNLKTTFLPASVLLSTFFIFKFRNPVEKVFL